MKPTADDDEAAEYFVYLLRIWLAKDDGRATWRASLEAAKTSQKLGFGRIDDLVTFLEQRFGEIYQRPPETPGS